MGGFVEANCKNIAAAARFRAFSSMNTTTHLLVHIRERPVLGGGVRQLLLGARELKDLLGPSHDLLFRVRRGAGSEGGFQMARRHPHRAESSRGPDPCAPLGSLVLAARSKPMAIGSWARSEKECCGWWARHHLCKWICGLSLVLAILLASLLTAPLLLRHPSPKSQATQ